MPPSTTRSRQRTARDAVNPSPIARLFVDHPSKLCAVVVAVPLAAAAAVLASGAVHLAPISTRDYLVRNEGVVRIDDMRAAARRDAFPRRGKERQFLEDGEGGGRVGEEGDESDDESGDDRVEEKGYDRVGEREFLVGDWGIKVLWRNDEEGNVLTRENVAEMKRREDEFTKSKKYDHFCWRDVNAKNCERKVPECAPVKSITRHPRLYGIQVGGITCGVREGHDVVSEEDWAAFLEEISVEAQAGNGERAILQPIGQLIGKDANRTVVPRSSVAMSVFQFGAPLRGFGAANRADLAKGIEKEQVEMYRDWVVGPLNEFKDPTGTADVKLDALAMGRNYAEVLVHKQVWKDLMFAAFSIGTVGLLMWLHTGSLFLSLATLLQVSLSFPLGYVVYRFLAQVKFFSALQILSVFLIIGIGADDCFIFVDAWKQSAFALGEDCDQVKRLTWTCGRAFKAMTVTSLTTALAFLFTATNPVLPVSTLGIWAGILVLVQFLLVLAMYPSSIIIWDNLKSKKLRGVARKPADESKDETEENIAPVIDVKDLSSFDESCGDDDDVLDIEKAESCASTEECVSDDEKEFRVVERFFHYRWSAWIHKLRWLLLAIGAAATGASIFLATHLKPLSDEETYWRSDHPLIVAPDLLKHAFLVDEYSGNYFIHTSVFWGVKKIENNGLSRYDLQSVGNPVYDDSFDLKPASAQNHMLTVCNSIENNEVLLPQINLGPRADCWISDFQKWRLAEKSANKSALNGFTSYADDQELVSDLKMFFQWTNETAVGLAKMPYMKHLRERGIAFSEDGSRVIYSELRFFTDVEKDKPWTVVWPMYKKWQEAMEDLQNDAPLSVGNGLMTGGHGWMWAATTRILFVQAFRGVGIMLGVAFVVLMVSTANIVTAFLATLSIGGITANLLGILSAAGFEVGVTVSISLIIAVGVSFDFCSHIANGYNASKQANRFERSREALRNLGISVIAGGVSSMLAISILFFATILFFTRFACIMVIVIALSLIFSLVFLIALLMVCGPEGNFGSLKRQAPKQ